MHLDSDQETPLRGERLASGRAPTGTLSLLLVSVSMVGVWWSARPSDSIPSLAATSWLDPATAPVESLRLLPGIGPTLAERIDQARRDGEAIETADDLRRVPGIGPRRVEALRPWLRHHEPGGPRARTDAGNDVGDPASDTAP